MDTGDSKNGTERGVENRESVAPRRATGTSKARRGGEAASGYRKNSACPLTSLLEAGVDESVVLFGSTRYLQYESICRTTPSSRPRSAARPTPGYVDESVGDPSAVPGR